MEMDELYLKIQNVWLASRPDPNDKEIKINMAVGSTPERLKISQAKADCTRKIRGGERGGDEELVKIGQAELRVLNLKPTLDDLALLRIDIKNLG